MLEQVLKRLIIKSSNVHSARRVLLIECIELMWSRTLRSTLSTIIYVGTMQLISIMMAKHVCLAVLLLFVTVLVLCTQ